MIKKAKRIARWGFSAKLMLMRGRTRQLWAIATSTVLALAWGVAFPARGESRVAAGMSAPPPAHVSIESAASAKLLQTHSDPAGQVSRGVGLCLALDAVGSVDGRREAGSAARRPYGPLHRRPPPSFS